MSTISPDAGGDLTAALVARAAALVPALRERARRTEQLRRLPPETVQDLLEAELVRIGTPHRYGGLDCDIDPMFEVAWELGRGCGSTGWCYGQWTIHNWLLGHYPERAQEEYYATGPDTLCSSGLSGIGVQCKRVDGGVRVSGRWEFSSGCDSASWAFVALPGPRNPVWGLLPRADYEIDDTWFVAGLRGTGSKDLVIRDAFIPAYRIFDPEQAGSTDLTGWKLHGCCSYHTSFRGITGWTSLASVGGIAQGALDEFTSRLQGTRGQGRTADSVALQLRLAEASAEVDAAHALVRTHIRMTLEKGSRGEAFTPLELARSARDIAFASRLCVRAVDRLFEASGAHAIAEAEPLQRFHRDIHSGSHHAMLNWDIAAQRYGQLCLDSESEGA